MAVVRRAVRVWSLVVVAGAAGSAGALPINTTLPGGWSWQPLGTGSYDTGLSGTARGGFNGQTSGPFEDTSYGIMNEPGTPWFTGGDLSAQQYVQQQVFGNAGTSSSGGFRFGNTGYTGPAGPTLAGPFPTASGTNFPRTAAERRSITLNHWSNANPDAGGVASFGQLVTVPVSATLTLGTGWGADEMVMRVNGGTSGAQSRFRIDVNIDAMFSTPAFGGIASTGNRINANAITTVPDAGSGFFEVPWGYGAGGSPNIISQTRGSADAVFVEGQFVQDPGQGVPPNSVGYSFSKNYDVLAALVQTGGTFTINYESLAEMFIERQAGNADARGSMGPGFEGTARLVVQFETFRAVPTPGAAGLLALAGVMAARRRR